MVEEVVSAGGLFSHNDFRCVGRSGAGDGERVTCYLAFDGEWRGSPAADIPIAPSGPCSRLYSRAAPAAGPGHALPGPGVAPRCVAAAPVALLRR